MAWVWDRRVNQYRNTETGRFLSRADADRMAEGSIDASVEIVQGWGDQVDDGTLSAARFRRNMRDEIKSEYIRQYIAARGGREMMTPADWGSVGGSIAEQFRWLDRFVAQIEAGEVTGGQIRMRAAMYVRSSNEARSRAYARSVGLGPELPAYPGDGTSDCLTNCNCSWDIIPVYNAEGDQVIYWECYWRLGGSEEHCATCLQRAGDWSPLRVGPDGLL